MTELRAGAHRFLLADGLAHRVDARRHQFLGIKRRAAGQQFVEQHPEAVDVAARINVQPAHLRLLRTHVGRRADELVQLRVNGVVRQATFRRLGDAEINHLRHRHSVVQRHEDVRRFDVAMDDSLLVRVLDGLADLDEQIEPFLGGEIGLIAVIRDANAAHQLHHEERPTHVGRARIQHLGDVGMIHHRQRLPFGFEPRDNLLGVHAQLDYLERHAPPHRFSLLRDIDHATPAFADPLKQLVAPERLAHGFIRHIGEIELDRWPGGFGLRSQKCFRLLVRSEQGVEACAQRRIAFAFSVEPCGAFRHGLAQRQLEQQFFAGQVHGSLLSAFSFASAALISAHDGARQTLRNPSPLIVPIVLPSGENWVDQKMEPSALNVNTSCQLATSQRWSAASAAPAAVASRSASGEKVTDWAPVLKPRSVAASRQPAVSQTRA